ncbi:response regulator [soil metagenome]
MATYTSYSKLVALVIDDMAVQQTTLRGQLGMLGVGKVEGASNADDAIRMIRAKPYGLILCDYHLNQKTDGQQLFEHLRDQNLLSADCLFFMVTAENSYASVVSATEHKPDCYLLKPITAGDIEDRLKMLIERRQALLPINDKISRKNLGGAIAECDKVLARKDRWTMQALQLKGQSLLQLGRPEEALDVYKIALEQRPSLIWAQLGVARAHKAANRFDEAKAVAHGIIQSKDGAKNVDAYDVVAQALEAQGDSQGAFQARKDSAAVVPSVKRHRLVGESAFRQGDLATAKACMAKVCAATKGSMTAQPLDALMLSQTLIDLGEPAQALAVLNDNANARRHDPQHEGTAHAIRAQGLARTGDAAGAAEAALRARNAMQAARPDFATIAVAKAELATGNDAGGLQLMQQVMSADHENPRVRQLIANALRDAGREDQLAQVVEGGAAAMISRVTEAKRLFRDSRTDEALEAIDAVAAEFPDNTAVLLQAAQMNCMSLRMKKESNAQIQERVSLYLGRLESLMPAHDRVTQMQRYYRETLTGLGPASSVPAGLASAATA